MVKWLSYCVGCFGFRLSAAYVAVRSGVDVDGVFGALGLPFSINDYAPGAGAFLVALAINKLSAPIRLMITAAVVPRLAPRLRTAFPKWFG